MRRGRYPKGESAQRQFSDDVRQGAYDVAAAVRKLHQLVGAHNTNLLTRPAMADVTDARIRLDAILADLKQARTTLDAILTPRTEPGSEARP